MPTSLLKYIWQHSRKQQLVIVLLTSISFPLLYFSLEIPKKIINEALSGDKVTTLFPGITLNPLGFLVFLCVLLLSLIIASGILKMRINTLKGIIGERLIRRLRYQLIQLILRFPSKHFARTSQGELISTITAEAEPLAGYISESVALPLFQGGTMITILAFMFAQDWVFGVASVALIPIQGYVIPKLQKQVNQLKKERVLRIRKLSERVGETISGAEEIRLQGTHRYTLAEFSYWLGTLFDIRLAIFRKKFFMKFLNNTIGQITPFLFYLLGGMLVIKGELTIGALVAALAAYKDLTSPWNELLNHYQAHEDAKIKYAQIIEQFSPAGLLPLHRENHERSKLDLYRPIIFENVSWQSESGERTISGLNLDIQPGSQVAIIGQNAIQRNRLAQLLIGLEKPASGKIHFGEDDIETLDDHLFRTRLGYQGPDPHFFNGTIYENVIYGLKHSPPPDQAKDAQGLQSHKESEASGNSTDNFFGDWLDYQRVGLAGPEEFQRHYFEGAAAIGSDSVMYQRGLLETFEPDDYPALAQTLLQARRTVRQKIESENLQRVVAEFDPDIYNRNATVAENILFGIPTDENFRLKNLAAHPYLQQTFSDLGLLDLALTIGSQAVLRIAQRVNEVPREHSLLNQFDIESVEELNQLSAIAAGITESEIDQEYKVRMIDIFLHLIPELHQFGFLSDEITTKLVNARHLFFSNMPGDLQQSVTRFDKASYHPKLNINENLLFGRMVAKEPAAEKRIEQIISQTLTELDAKRDVMLLLTQSQVGISGKRLPEAPRHTITLGRMLAKRPQVMVFHDALGPLDQPQRHNIRRNLRKLMPDSTLIWIDREVDNLLEFDKVYKFTEDGALTEMGEATPVSSKPNTDSISIIGQSPIFGKLSVTQQQLLSEHSHRVTAEAGDFIFSSGNPSRNAYIIIQGQAASLRDANDPDTVTGKPAAGETIGVVEIMAQRDRILSVKAETDLELLRIDGSKIQEVIQSDPVVMQIMLRAITDQWAAAPQSRK